MATKITDNYFEFGVNKYFRGNAHLVEIATYGEKKDPVGGKAYLDPQNTVKRDYLVDRVDKGAPVGVNWNATTKADLEANGPIQVFVVTANVATTFSYEKVKAADLKLYNLSIPEGKLQALLNNDASGALKYLAEEGNDGRIVSEVWVVMEAELAEHFDTSSSFSIAVKGVDLNVTATGGTCGTQTITLSAGTTFAYKLHKVKKWNNDKSQTKDWEADYYGMA